MRALAEFVMRGRPQAMGAALVCSILPLLNWLGAAIVSLVILRKGAAEGFLVLLWAGLPLMVGLYLAGGVNPTPLIWLVSAALLAYVLRVTMSWELTVVSTVIIAGVGTVIFELTAVDLLAQFSAYYVDYAAQVTEGALQLTESEAKDTVMSFVAMGQAIALVVVLVLARWWQSMLFNPGGFRQEFHALRLSPSITTPLVIAMLSCVVFTDQLGRWLPLLSMPLLVSGIGFVHWFLDHRKMSVQWAVMFYLAIVMLLQLVYPILASLALIDSWLDLRSRLSPPGPPAPPQDGEHQLPERKEEE